MTTSRGVLRVFPLISRDQAVDLGEFSLQGGFYARRPPVSVRNLGNMLPTDAQPLGNPAVHPIGEFFSIDEGIHIFCERDKRSGGGVPSESEDYPRWDKLVKKKIRKILLADVSEPVGQRMRAARKARGLNQDQLGELLGVGQSRITKWENGTLIIPSPVMVRMSELVPDGIERQWWRDQAARIAGFAENVAGDVTSVPLSSIAPFRTIPLIRNPLKVGILGQMDVSEVQENLQLPQHWFSEGGTIRAVTIKDNPLSPMIAGDYIAIIDVSRRDPDRLTDCVVAVRTVTGIDARILRKDRNVYFLQAMHETPGQSIRILKHDGEDSIVGQVLKWIADAPGPLSKHRKLN